MKKNQKKKNLSEKDIAIRNIGILSLKIIIIFLMFYLIFTSVFGIIRIKSDMMAPSIRDGDLLMYYRIDKDYHAGDVVVAKIAGKKYVLRIAGVGGDFIEIRKDKLLINGAPEEHVTYYNTKKDNNKKIKYPYRVKNKHYFLVSDYRSYTEDSRKFGNISEKNILGKVIGKLQTRNI